MALYLITYDLDKDSNQYKTLTNEIEKIGDSIHILDSVWIVKTNINAPMIKEKIAYCFSKENRSFIIELKENASWDQLGLPEEFLLWIPTNW